MPLEDRLGAVGETHREGWVNDRVRRRGACGISILAAVAGLRWAGPRHKNAGVSVATTLQDGPVSNDAV